jgi:hypothetical protein
LGKGEAVKLNLLKKCVQRKLLSLILIVTVVEGFIGFTDIVHVFGQSSSSIQITLRWRKSAGTGNTFMGPLAADLNNDGLMEIVINGQKGIAALNPLNGNVIWFKPYTASHGPCEIIDLNKDGIPEILFVPDYVNGTYTNGVLALHGNDGSVYWFNRNAAGDDTYIAVADINADGYPEIYSVRPSLVTALTYDGRIFASTYTYYSCSGGLSIGDTDFDGVFEVYLGERSNTYPPPTSPGRGIRAFWANNLTEIWCDPEILCSSQAPVLADVDKDGDLEILILHQRKGIAVYNTDGSVNTYKGKYRRQLSIPELPSNGHSNPTVADVDDDGNLELIQCGSADGNWYNPAIWDLVEWKLNATLPFKSMEPPGVADIDGDGKLEILVPTERNVTILKYDKDEGKYEVIYTIENLPGAHPFFIAQDIDGDGDLELIFNQYNSWVSVYDVIVNGEGVLAPSPLPRSGRCLYSEYRTRVPVYVPPPDQPPKISEISPSDGATSVPTTLSELSFKLVDAQGDLMNYTVTTNPNIGEPYNGTNVASGTIITVPVSGLVSSTTYTWNVTVTDGEHTTTRTFTFYTQGNVTLTISINGTGAVIKNPDNETYAYGTRVKLTAVADNVVYTFSSWGGDLAPARSNNPATIIMDGDKNVTAKFTKIEYTLKINVSPTGCGSVNVSKPAPYYYNDTVELTAVASNSSWSFSYWSISNATYPPTGSINSTQNPVTIIMDNNKMVTAVFVEAPAVQYNLTISVTGNGATNPAVGSYMYGEGTVVSVTAIPESGWMFDHWVLDDNYVGSTNPYNVTMNSNHTLEAVFVEIPPPPQYELVISVSGMGTTTPAPRTYLYDAGTEVEVTAVPESGYMLDYWLLDAVNVGKANPYAVRMDSNHTLMAVFTESNWWNADWQHRRTITIDHTKVSGNLTDFPVLIEITDSNLTKKAQPDGDDFVFTDANNMKLDHQIELYDSATGHLIAWVKVPHLSSTTDTILYMYYGNPTCENQQNPTAVWDENYKLVLHLNENTGIQYDSTINGNNGTPYNGVVQGTTSKIDGGDTFDGSNDYVQVPHSNTLTGYAEAFTVSFWIRLEDTSKRQTILCKYNTAGNMRSWQVEYDPLSCRNNPFWFFASQDGITYSQWWASFIPTAGVWYHVTIVWETNAIPKFYINGVQVPTIGTDKITSIYNNVGTPLRIARSLYADRHFKGSLDEITVSNIARSADWILTTYNNQFNPTTFYSVGTEETSS